jgi:hypothetical protein
MENRNSKIEDYDDFFSEIQQRAFSEEIINLVRVEIEDRLSRGKHPSGPGILQLVLKKKRPEVNYNPRGVQFTT